MREWTFPSSSSPTIYRTQIGDNGLLSCTCPGWTVKKLGKVRECKHTKKVANDEGLTLEERDGQYFVVTAQSVKLPPLGDEAGRRASTRSVPAPSSIKRQEAATEVKGGLFISPMLASAMPEGKTADSFNADWIMEEKFDGHRLVIRVEEHLYSSSAGRRGIGGQAMTTLKEIEAWSRLGNQRSLPNHIAEPMLEMPVGVYDGELIVPSSQHSYSVTAGQNSGNEALVLFDMLEVDGKSIVGVEQHVRRAFLEIALDTIESSELYAVHIAKQFKPSVAAVQEIWDRGGEGAIIKKLSAKYNPGWRSPDWIKVKAQLSAVLTIVGFAAGKNGPYSIIKLRADDGIETTVKTLDNNMMRQFAAAPNSYIGKRLVVSYQEKTPSGKLRHIMADHLAGDSE